MCNTAHPHISETAAIGIPIAGGGPEQLHIVAVLKQGAGGEDESGKGVEEETLKKAFNRALQQKLNPLFKVSGFKLYGMNPSTDFRNGYPCTKHCAIISVRHDAYHTSLHIYVP